MGLVDFQRPLRREKKLLLENKIRFSFKVNIYLKTCLKSENVNIENEGAAAKNF